MLVLKSAGGQHSAACLALHVHQSPAAFPPATHHPPLPRNRCCLLQRWQSAQAAHGQLSLLSPLPQAELLPCLKVCCGSPAQLEPHLHKLPKLGITPAPLHLYWLPLLCPAPRHRQRAPLPRSFMPAQTCGPQPHFLLPSPHIVPRCSRQQAQQEGQQMGQLGRRVLADLTPPLPL